jgi:Fe-S cluster biogenesis protein NfuA
VSTAAVQQVWILSLVVFVVVLLVVAALLTLILSASKRIHGGVSAFINRLIADPAIRMLFMSYDLIAPDRRLAAEEALDAVRGHLHAHGVDVEILEVVGGVVYVRLHGMTAGRLAESAVVHDLEEALRAGFIGFSRTGHPRAASDCGNHPDRHVETACVPRCARRR